MPTKISLRGKRKKAARDDQYLKCFQASILFDAISPQIERHSRGRAHDFQNREELVPG
jgi:hypothetical protein